jgi:hypothetical protein
MDNRIIVQEPDGGLSFQDKGKRSGENEVDENVKDIVLKHLIELTRFHEAEEIPPADPAQNGYSKTVLAKYDGEYYIGYYVAKFANWEIQCGEDYKIIQTRNINGWYYLPWEILEGDPRHKMEYDNRE